MKKKQNSGEGYGFMFHGSFLKKSDAVEKERSRPGSFVKTSMTKHGMRYIVMSPRKNPIKRHRKNPAEGSTPAARAAFKRAHRSGMKATKLIQKAQAAWGKRNYEKLKEKAMRAVEANSEMWREFQRIEAESGRKNPAELVIMGANPLKDLGSNPTVRENPVNPLFSFHPGMLTGRQQRARYGRTPFNRRVAAMVRRARGHGRSTAPASLKSEVQAALVSQGYKRTDAKKAVARASGDDFSSLFRDAQSKIRENPSAASLRETFTGKPADWEEVMEEPHMPAGDYAQLGELMALYVTPCTGGQRQEINFGRGEDRPILVSDESGRQLWFVSGNQDVSGSLSHFGARDQGNNVFELGHVRRIDYKQRKEHVPDPEHDEWRHDFGEESGVYPTLLFDAKVGRLLLKGGEYKIRAEGIIN